MRSGHTVARIRYWLWLDWAQDGTKAPPDRIRGRLLPLASGCRLITPETRVLPQGTSTPSIHAHAGRTQRVEATFDREPPPRGSAEKDNYETHGD